MAKWKKVLKQLSTESDQALQDAKMARADLLREIATFRRALKDLKTQVAPKAEIASRQN